MKTAEVHPPLFFFFLPAPYGDNSGAFGGLKVLCLYTVITRIHPPKATLPQGDTEMHSVCHHGCEVSLKVV